MPPKAPPAMPPPAHRQEPVATGPTPQLAMAQPLSLAPKMVLLGVEGWGKSSCAAFMSQPAILMAREETGYLTLLGRQLVPQCLATTIEDWQGLLALLDDLLGRQELPMQTLVLDALGGFERMCHEHVCRRDFNGDWGEKGFMSFHKGFEVAVGEWLKLIQRLEALHRRGVIVMLLGHVQSKPFNNPLGENYDRLVCDVHHKTWAPTHRFADAVLFGTYITIVDKKGGRAKGIGGADRILYCTRRDAFDAKNRYGMPDAIQIPHDPAQIWTTIHHYIQRGQ